MTWEVFHRESEALAWRAHELKARGQAEQARDHFRRAAEAEQRALADVNPETESRTYAVTAVSACALWFKAGEFESARQVARQALAVPSLDGYAVAKLTEMLHRMARSQSSQRGTSGQFWSRPTFWAPTAIVAILLLAGAYYLWLPKSYTTATGVSREVKLDDGSIVYLNTRTKLEWIGKQDDRRVRLVEGEALFEVVHDTTKPFRVVLDHSEIVVVGTKFNVYEKSGGEIVVEVIEGEVQVRTFAPTDGKLVWQHPVKATQSIEYRGTEILRAPYPVAVDKMARWRSSIFTFDDMALEDIVTELMRYTDEPILIRDPDVAGIHMGGALNTKDVRGSLQRLEASANIKVVEKDGVFTIVKAPANKDE